VAADLRHCLRDALLILAAGTLLGLAVNHRLVLDAFSGRLTAAVPAAPTGSASVAYPPLVLLEEVRELFTAGAVLLDARAAGLYAEGHLPGARSVPLAEVDVLLETLGQAVPPEVIVVTYCSGFGCTDSFDLGVRLLAAGWRDVRVYEGGFPEWRDAGLPVEAGAP
jgi:rhodanese-related sulfurtransferase